MDTSNETSDAPQSDRERVAPPPDRAAAKAALMEKWIAAEKTGEVPPLKAPADEEAERAAAEDPDANPTAQAETAPEEPQTEEPAVEAAPVDEPPAEQDPATLRGLAAIEARDKKSREEHRQRMLEVQDYHANVRAKEREMAERERRVAERDTMALRDPVGYFRALGYKGPLRDIAELFFVADVGDEAPPDLRAKAQVFGVQAEQRRLREEFEAEKMRLDHERHELAMERQRQEYRAQLNADVTKLAPAKHGYVAALARRDPNRTIELMFSEAQLWARENPDSDTPPSAEELAERVAKKYDPNYGVKTPPTKNPPPGADEKRPAVPNTQNLTGRTQLRPPPKTREELREQIRRRLEAGDVE